MPRIYGRNRRVADLVQREIATLIQKEIPISETGMITVSFVDVSPDLKNAKIYYTCLASELSGAAVRELLNRQVKHFRHHLAKTLPLRVVPELVFLYDESIRGGRYLSALIDSVNETQPGS